MNLLNSESQQILKLRQQCLTAWKKMELYANELTRLQIQQQNSLQAQKKKEEELSR